MIDRSHALRLVRQARELGISRGRLGFVSVTLRLVSYGVNIWQGSGWRVRGGISEETTGRRSTYPSPIPVQTNLATFVLWNDDLGRENEARKIELHNPGVGPAH